MSQMNLAQRWRGAIITRQKVTVVYAPQLVVMNELL